MDGGKIIDAVTLMEQVEKGRAPSLGRVVGIVGGGNTAMDAARMAKRLGAEEAVIIFRFDKAQMEAHPYEAMEAFAEGVKIKWLSTVKQFGEDEIVVEQMEMLPDGSGCVGTGQFQTLKTDSLVLAVGQHADVEFLKKVPDLRIGRGNVVEVDAQMRAGDGIFAGGDMIGGARTMTAAVGHGKKAARNIDAWLRGGVYEKPPQHPPVPYELLNLTVFLDADRREHAELPVAKRTGFDEIVSGLSETRGALRGDAVPLLRQLLRVRQLLRRLPRAGDRQAGEGPVLSGRARPLHRLRRVLRTVPVPCHRHGARARGRGHGRPPRSRESARPLHRPGVA